MRRRPTSALLLAGLLATLTAGTAAPSAMAAESEVLPLSSAGISVYADVCRDASSANDVKNLVFGPTPKEDRYGVIVEGCDAGGAADFDVLFATNGATSPDRRLRVTSTGGTIAYTLTDLPSGTVRSTGVGLRRDDRMIQVLLPVGDLSPVGSTIRLRALAGTGTGQDQLPDATRPMVVFPNDCQGGSTVLSVGDGDAEAVARLARTLDAQVGVVDEDLGIVEIESAAPDVMRRLGRLRGVARAEVPAPVERFAVSPNDPQWSRQWAPVTVGAPVAWATRTGSDKRIAIVDDGIDGRRADLSGRVAAGMDLVSGTAIPAGADSDLGGHGTAVAGIAAGRGNDGAGMVGVDWTATLLPYRVFDESGCAGHAELAGAIRAATDAGAHVINLSLGSPSPSSALHDAVRYAASRGVVLVAASGNSGPGSPAAYPAAYAEVIAVGATTSSDTIAGYSSTGSHIEVTAPGGSSDNGVLSLGTRDGFTGMIGTSFASPMVAAAAALYLAEHPTATASSTRSALAATAHDLGPTGRDSTYGYGRLDLAALLAADAPAGDGPTTGGTTPSEPTPSEPTEPAPTEPTEPAPSEPTEPAPSEPAPSEPTSDPCEGADPTSFTDLSGGAHDASITCLVHLGVTSGVTATTYVPAGDVSRGQMASFLARYITGAGAELPAGRNAFSDDDGNTHEAAIDALAAAGIVSGVTATTYAPEATVTRGQMATFLARTYGYVAGAPLPAGPDYFADDDGNVHEAAINRVVSAEIASGRADGSFGPGAVVRRDHMATFIVGLARAIARA